MRMLFLMDPLESILLERDTTFALMLEAQARGHEVHYATLDKLFLVGSRPRVAARRVAVRRKLGDHFTADDAVDRALEHFNVIFIRKDPPFDAEYLLATWVLSLVDPGRTFVVNDPQGIRSANEKLYALTFPEIIPRTLVTRDRERLRELWQDCGGELVLKSLDSSGGSGVFRLRASDPNAGVILDACTREGRVMVVAQEYLPAVTEGDKRILLLDGEPIGAVLRIPQGADFRGNLHVGARPVATEVSPRDRQICDLMAPRLREDGLHFVGIDVIGGMLTEVNVTSPTGLCDIDRLCGTRLATTVIEFVEERVPQGQA